MKKRIMFYSLLDFFPKKEIIKAEYNVMTKEQKKQYKMYVYSLPFMEDDVKDEIWEYLNNWLEDYNKLCSKYEKTKRRYDKRRKEINQWDI